MKFSIELLENYGKKAIYRLTKENKTIFHSPLTISNEKLLNNKCTIKMAVYQFHKTVYF